MDKLKKLRASQKAKFTRLQTFLDGCPARPSTVEELRARLKILDSTWDEYQVNHNEILELTSDDDIDDEETEYGEIETKWCNLEAGLKQQLALAVSAAATTSASSTSDGGSGSTASTPDAPPPPAVPDVKLPRMDLPIFHGNPMEWASFRDLFTSIIHNNTKISDSQKLHYLKNSVKDEAATLLHSIDITDANYTEAWTLLKERYENKRLLIQSHLKMLFSQPAMSQESATSLRKLLDDTIKCVRALRALGQTTDEWDPILVFVVTDRLDSDSRRQWEISSPGTDYPKFDDLKVFIEQRCRALEATSNSKLKQSQTTTKSEAKRTTSVHHSSTEPQCPYCQSCHLIFQCPGFAALDIKEKNSVVRKLRLCFNCLRLNHSVRNCQSKSTCRKCGSNHHTLMHSTKPAAVVPAEGNSQSTTAAVASHVCDSSSSAPGFLATAEVTAIDYLETDQLARVLLDIGSQASFISNSYAQRLGVKKSKANMDITGMGQVGSGRCKGTVNVVLHSRHSDFSISASLLVMNKLTSQIPGCYIDKTNWKHLAGLKLADPNFNQPGEIDIILGADYCDFIFRDGRIPGPVGVPSARNTHFGWVVTGKIESIQSYQVMSNVSTMDLENQLKQFWELEEIGQQSLLTQEEQECESFFMETYSRDAEGRFTTPLPFKKNDMSLGLSKDMATKRLHQVERRLDRHPEFKNEYRSFMDKYLELGHMELIPSRERHERQGLTNYLPHHFVLKESSSTTSFRVVFDASAKTSSGTSLNQMLMVGPKIQDDMYNILLRFRLHRYAFTADIAKMYRQIRVPAKDSEMLRILWRNDRSKPVEEYRLLTVTYGTSSAPYTAVKALQQLAEEEAADFPLAKEVAMRDFYVDDVMSGDDCVDTALQMQSQLIQMCNRGGMQLRKWASNKPTLLESVPPEYRETQVPFRIDCDDTIKALGLHWHTATDHFSFKVNLAAQQGPVSKRIILSETARLFDPLGWLAPVIVVAKILFQNLWIVGLSWDDQLPENLQQKWLNFRQQLFELEKLQIPRHVGADAVSYQLHGFGDASEQAYAAVVYLRTVDSDGNTTVSLLSSKTKVAPVKKVTIPKLELCGAVLVSRLLKKVRESLHIPINEMYGWTDSTVTLGWISGNPSRWKTFVGNRVAQIQEILSPSRWHHVPGADNPADCASRGIFPEEFLTHPLWWTGPSWLSSDMTKWPQSPQISIGDRNDVMKEVSPTRVLLGVQVHIPDDLLHRLSSLSKLKRVTAYCFRFILNSRSSISERKAGSLTPKELNEALLYWIKLVQHQQFTETISCLQKKQVPKQLLSLNPFLDENEILRVGGRIHQSKVKYDQKHPILLPKKHHLTNLIVDYEHIKLLHAGYQLLLGSLNQRYWIIGGRSIIRQHIHKCMTCFRDRGITLTQQMAELPQQRLEPNRPFLKTGVDFGGPFSIKHWKGRGGKIIKAYLSLFVCLSTKAVHLELVSDLTAEAFLAALKRFIARRGRCTDIWSDNGTNFVGANNELKKLALLMQSNQIVDPSSQEGIQWHFIPAKAPHFGGIWEAGIKSAKTHLRRVIGDTILTFEEMTTTLTQVEACLNSRPLCPLSTDPSDLTALTPGHFLIGEALTSVPEPDLTELKVNRLSRWQLSQQLVQHFWGRWHKEYLTGLQHRSKWASKKINLAVGDLVLIKEDNFPPMKWLMGRVTATHPGKDNCVRVVSVKTINGISKRPIVKLCLLPIDD